MMGGEHCDLTVTQTDRRTYFDYLRVLASFAVMILHIAAQNWNSTDVNSFEWQVFNAYDSVVRWSVPVFVMISGALFLEREIPLGTIYKKYILRLVVSFAAWSMFYVLFEGGSIKSKLRSVVQGHYHMWFLLMLIGIYMCIPLIKTIAESRHQRYYLVLALVFSFILPEAISLVRNFGSERMLFVASLIERNYSTVKQGTEIVFGYAAYFILGYCLDRYSFTKKQRNAIYLAGAIGFLSTILLSSASALKIQKPSTTYYGNFTVNVLLEAIAVFTLFRYAHFDKARRNRLMIKLSKYSFGAYLVHVFILERIRDYAGLTTMSFNPVASVFCIGLMVFALSYLVSAILNHIPIVKKYIV